ncbi:MAG: hypothetical protein F6K62_10275 [Sphaerospermopsis sp. SIO1G2]|nr:hypothetical protein [Sphaerospermopsis sp. SIO1G2]
MKKLLLTTACITAVLAGGHYYLWQQQVEILKQQADNYVARLNDHFGKSVASFSYDEKRTGGYPMAAEVVYVNPKVSFSEELFETIEHLPPAHFSVEEISIAGTLAVRNEFLQNKASLVIDGVNDARGTYYGEPFHHSTTTTSGENYCSMHYNDPITALLEGKYLIDQVESVADFIDAVHGMECHARGITIRDELNDRVVSEAEHYHVDLSFVPSKKEDEYKITLAATIDGFVDRADPRSYIRDIEHLLSPLSDADQRVVDMLESYPPLPLFDPARLGKQNMALDMSYEGTIDLEQGADALQENGFRFSIDRFEADNELYRISYPFSVNYSPDTGVSVRHNGEAHFTATYDQIVADSVDIAVDMLKDVTINLDEEEKQMLAAVSKEDIRGLLPALSSVGTIRSYINMDAALEKDKKMNVESLGFNTDQFGLVVKGNAAEKVKSDAPAWKNSDIDMDIICTHCHVLLHRLASYGNHINGLAHKIGESPVPVAVTNEALQAVSGFIGGFDTDDADNTVTMQLKTDENGQITLSGKPMATVVLEAMFTLAPHFQHVQEAITQTQP